MMKLSARNVLKGKVVNITRGGVSSVVVVEIAPGLQLTSMVTAEAVQDLDLTKGKEAYVIIKSSNLMLAVDE
jgi:molybdopterin-binding protein